MNVSLLFQASCNLDVTYFPFDTQVCSIFIAPWGYDNSELQIAGLKSASHGYLSQDHSSWGLTGVSAIGNNAGKTSFLNVTVSFTRHYESFLINVLLPPILLSVINPCVFLLPAASGERMSFSITCFLSFSVFLTLLGDNMPKSATPISHLSFFLMYMLVHSCCISLVTIISLKIYHKDGISPVPRWLQVVVNILRFRYCKSGICKGDVCSRKTHVTKEKEEDLETIEMEYISEKKIQPEVVYQPPDVITWYLVGKTFDYFAFCLFLGWMLFSTITVLMSISLI